MIYNAGFRDINNNLYTIKITNGTKGTIQRNLTLGSVPFKTEMDSSDDTIYKPVKYQSASCNIITPDYNFDIYSGKAQGTKIELSDSKGIAWTGYIEPNLYNMGFEEEREEIELSCIDALATLQYIKYTTDKKKVTTLLSIINKAIKNCNAYTGFVFSANTQLNNTNIDSILDKLYISEQNFYDDKKPEESDTDVAWTYKDVLEEICKFLGVTAVADRDLVYFLDYDAIKNGINDYYKYTIDNPTPEKITVSFNKTITADDYSNSGASLSIDNVYNKVKITDDLYTFDEILPDMFDRAINITADSDTTLQNSNTASSGIYGEVVANKVGNTADSKNKNMIVFLDTVRNPDGGNNALNVVFVKYFNNPYYKFYKYDANGRDITDSIKSLNYTDTKSMHGATIAKFCVKKLDVGSDIPFIFSDLVFKVAKGTITLDNWLAANEFSKVDFSDYIVLLNPQSNHISNDNITQYPYLQTVVSDTTALFGGDNAYLIISGNYMYHYYDDDPYPIPEGESDISEGRYAMDAGQTYLMAKLQWGNLYWSGDQKKGNNGWVTTETTFKIPYMKDDAGKGDRRADATMFKNLKFINSVNWRIGTNEQGYLITLPKNGVISGLPTLTVYKPFDPNFHSAKSGKDKGQHYKHSCVFLKDFKFKAIIGDPTFSKVNDSDTIYTNDINTDYVKELGDIKFKVCTWDNKKPNYSSIAIKKTDGSMEYLDKTYNRATRDIARQEEHLIQRIYNQYNTASVILQLPLRNDNYIYGLYRDTTINDRVFIVDYINRDYRNNQVDIKLIEKK